MGIENDGIQGFHGGIRSWQRRNREAPVLSEGQKKIVIVTHDESTFYSNDGKEDLWLKGNGNAIRKKSPGGSIMVSEFQCACHGTMRIKG